MTQFGCKLFEDKAFILSDRLAVTENMLLHGDTGREVEHHYKPHLLEDIGAVLVGRGTRKIFEIIHETIIEAAPQGFDELICDISEPVKEGYNRFISWLMDEVGAELPSGWTLQDAIENIKEHSAGRESSKVDPCFVGWSKDRQCFALASCWSYKGFVPEVVYHKDRPGLFFFPQWGMPEIVKKFKRVGRYPETIDELVWCMRVTYKAHVKTLKGKLKNPEAIGGGNIDLTILYPDGSTEVQGLGPLVEPAQVKQGKVGRNDPCPCGSGKKHKKCCLTS
jgi:hypothetical protein